MSCQNSFFCGAFIHSFSPASEHESSTSHIPTFIFLNLTLVFCPLTEPSSDGEFGILSRSERGLKINKLQAQKCT